MPAVVYVDLLFRLEGEAERVRPNRRGLKPTASSFVSYRGEGGGGRVHESSAHTARVCKVCAFITVLLHLSCPSVTRATLCAVRNGVCSERGHRYGTENMTTPPPRPYLLSSYVQKIGPSTPGTVAPTRPTL